MVANGSAHTLVEGPTRPLKTSASFMQREARNNARKSGFPLFHTCLRPRGRASAVHLLMHEHQDSRTRMTPRYRTAHMPTTYPAIPTAADVTKSTIAYLRCGAGQNDWQARRILATSKYVAFTLPKPVLKEVRDIIHFCDILSCEVSTIKVRPRIWGSNNETMHDSRI